MEQSNTTLRTAAYFFIIVIGIAVLFFVLKILREIFIPFVVAYFLYFIFLPVNNFLKKRRLPLWSAVLIDILIMVLIIGGVSTFVIGTFSSFSDQLPEYADKLSKTISKAASALGINDPSLQNFKFKDAAKQIDLRMIAGGAFASTLAFLGNLVIMFIFFAFITSGHPVIYNALRRRFAKRNTKEASDEKESNQQEEQEKEKSSQNETKKTSGKGGGKKKSFSDTFQEITDQVQKYFISKVVISLITAGAEGLTVFLFGVDFAIVWAVLIFFLNFIPGIGSLIALSLPCLLALLTFDSMLKAVLMIVTLIIMDTVLGDVIEPLMFGDRMKINPLVILFSLLIWGYVWGVIGALLSVPIMAVFKIVISKSKLPDLVFINDLMDTDQNGKAKTSSA